MKWSNLRINKCPQCDLDLFKAEVVGGMFHCKCGFKITEEKMKTLINKSNFYRKEEHYRPDDEVPEDY